MKKEIKLNDDVLINIFENCGILHEVNRTFFHSLGIRLDIENGKLIAYQTTTKHGYIMEKIDKFKMHIFRNFSNRRMKTRSELLGFTIQVVDVVLDKLSLSKPANSSLRLSIILDEVSSFVFSMYKRIIEKHKDFDTKDPWKQLNYSSLLSSLNKNMESRNNIDIVDTANLLALIVMMNNINDKLCNQKSVGENIDE